MSEYLNVEKPFLEKLRQLNWEVIDRASTTLFIGAENKPFTKRSRSGHGIPQDLLTGKKEVISDSEDYQEMEN